MAKIVGLLVVLLFCVPSFSLALESSKQGEEINDNITCVATFIAKEGCADRLGKALSALLEPTRKEKGCISYVLYKGVENPNLFTMIEQFKDKEAFEFHSQQDYLINFKKSAAGLIESVSVNIHKNAETP